jgi:hypothetical protein
LLDHIDGHERHFFIWYLQRAPVALAALVNPLEAFAVPECNCYPRAERIQKIVFSFIVLVADPKALAGARSICRNCSVFDLSDQVKIGSANSDRVEFVVGWVDWSAPAAGQAALLTPSGGEK